MAKKAKAKATKSSKVANRQAKPRSRAKPSARANKQVQAQVERVAQAVEAALRDTQQPPEVVFKPATRAIRRIMADKALALPRLRRLKPLPTNLVAAAVSPPETETPAAVNLGALRIEEVGQGVRLRHLQQLTTELKARSPSRRESPEVRRERQQREVAKLLAEVDARIEQTRSELPPASVGITPKTRVPAAVRIDRAKLYSDCNLELRLAVFNLINAVSQVEIAQTLHGSRQPSHLERAEAQLHECQSRLYAALRAMKPMREFVPAYARSKA